MSVSFGERAWRPRWDRVGALVLGVLAAACHGGGTFQTPPPPDGGSIRSVAQVDGGLPGQHDGGFYGYICPPDSPAFAGSGYVPPPVASAVTKVKNLLVGLPATDAEVAAVAADESALFGLVGQWMSLPQYSDKMQAFFMTAFQQDQVAISDFNAQFYTNPPFYQNQNQIVGNFQESFARTVMELIAEGQPFTSAMTTRRFMMTPALMAAYAQMDAVSVSDSNVATDFFQLQHPTGLKLQSNFKIPLNEAVDPSSRNFMTFYDPTVATSYGQGCAVGTVAYPSPITTNTLAVFLFNLWPASPANAATGSMAGGCRPPQIPPTAAYFTDSDFTSWRMVTIRPPAPGESVTQFYALPLLRSTHELVLKIPRVGFFTTPAFFARWPTNQSNVARVTANQTMIVALGAPIDLSNQTYPADLSALDSAHAAPQSTCYYCHRTLDPMRQIFRNAYTLQYTQQLDPTQTSLPGQFGFQGVTGANTSVYDLGDLLATHPMLATAWVQKLCTYATSAVCDQTDPEFIRLVNVFVTSNYSWNALVQALFSSPIVTYLKETQTADAAQTFPIARREHLCATLSNRLGITDLCQLNPYATSAAGTGNAPAGKLNPIPIVAGSWPADAYGRGNPALVLANTPSLFMRGGMETMCASLADRLVDTPNGLYSSSDPDKSIQSMANGLMGLTTDELDGPVGILTDHFHSAQQELRQQQVDPGVIDLNAMKSTFILACLSPQVAGVGQ